MHYRRNIDEDIRILERQLLSGDESIVDPYITQLYRIGEIHAPINANTQDRQKIIDADRQMSHQLFQINPQFVILYLQLDPPERKNSIKLYAVDPQLAIRYISDPYQDFRTGKSYGKFSCVLDSLIYNLDDDEFETNEGWGDNAHLYRFSPDEVKYLNEMSLEETGEPLTSEEMIQIINSVGAIMEESGQGFVNVTFYPDSENLERNWDEIRNEFQPEGDEEDEDLEDNSDEF